MCLLLHRTSIRVCPLRAIQAGRQAGTLTAAFTTAPPLRLPELHAPAGDGQHAYGQRRRVRRSGRDGDGHRRRPPPYIIDTAGYARTDAAWESEWRGLHDEQAAPRIDHGR